VLELSPRGSLLGCMVAALLLVAAVPSDAEAAWGAPQPVFAVGAVSELLAPSVARDAAGDAVAVWDRYRSGHGESGAVEAATERAGGAWSAPVRLSSGSTGIGDPEVVMDSRGEATVVWEQSTVAGKPKTKRTSGRFLVEARSHSVNGGWGRTVMLASSQIPPQEDEQPAPDPQVAVDHRGGVVAAFNVRERNAAPVNGREDILLFTRRDGRWGKPVVIAHTVNNGDVRLAVDGRGEALVAWNHGGPSGSREAWVQALVIAHNGRPEGSVQTLSARSKTSYALDLAVNSRGGAVLAWSQELGEGEGYGPVEVATRPAGGRFTTKPVTVVRKSVPAVAAINQQGTATVLFGRSIPAKGLEQEEDGPLEAVTHPADAGWRKPEIVSPVGIPQAMTCGPNGELVALWEAGLPLSVKPTERHRVIDASIQAAGGAWQPPETISPENTAEDASGLALATNGGVTAIWVRGPISGTQLIETAHYEPA
jgi:hypothetical protein